MNTPHDPHREAFSDEERELAGRLARLGGPREPSASLDAAILAAARAAVAPAAVADASDATTATPPSTTRQDKVVALRTRKPRWPVGLSLAASLALAAGIGFKMLDEGTSHDTAESAAADAAVAFKSEASEPLAEAVLIEPSLQRTPPPPPPPLADAGVEAEAMAVPQRARPPATTTAGRSAEAAAEMDFSAADAAAPAESSASPIPAAPAAQPVQHDASDEDALDRIEVTGSRISRDAARSVGAAEHTRTPLSKRREQSANAAQKTEDSRQQDDAERRRAASAPPAPPPAAPPVGSSEPGFSPNPREDKAAGVASDAYDDRPPVSADSPEFRQAWLQRIRKLLAEGRRTEARTSLLEFRRRYPETTVPEDLRLLLTPEPAPPTP